jgi:hypothetical protein
MTPIRSNIRATWLVAACVTAALASPARAVVLCARESNGVPSEGASVKVRAICKDNEVALDPVALGIATGPTTTIVRTGNPVSTNGTVSTPATCAAGEVATGGGVLSTGTDGGVAVLRSSRPQPDTAGATPTAWRSTVTNLSDTGTITATPYVVCAVTTP